MSNATVLRPGQVNGAGDADELFLKVWSGEVMTAFEEACKTEGKHIVRSITSGKSASFPATWKVSASYHTPGAEILGQVSNLNERIINIDDVLIADVFLADIDEAKSHFEYRSEYTRQAGFALANRYDKTVLQVMVLAARASATVTGGSGGTALTSATTLYRTSATDLAAGIYAGVQAMDEKDVPEFETKSVFVRPAQYYLLAQSTALINRDWMGAGSYSDGKILRIGGAEIVKTNHLPITDLSATVVTGEKNTYYADFSKTAAVITTRNAVGTVKLRDLSTRSDYDPRRLGTLIVSKNLIGHGILRPECAVELKTTA
jgi:hypothetical protein